MAETGDLPPSPIPSISQVTVGELFSALSAGWFDFKSAPAFGMFFSSVYVLGGIALVYLGAGTVAWALTLTLGFPLVAPFAAVGLYEVSRRLEKGETLVWREILGVVVREKERQIPWLGAIIVIFFLFWTFVAHLIFALFMGPSALINVSTSIEIYMSFRGFGMIAAELIIGGIFAFVLFCMTAFSLPLLLDLEIDFVTAMMLSYRTVRSNLVTMMIWAMIIAVFTFLAMIPMFLGLFIALPVLGHATWHLYRRALYQPT